MQDEIVFGFDIGTNSTKVSFSPPGQTGTILTKEFPNVILFLEGNERYFGEEALKKIAESPELHSSSFVTNFVNLINLTTRKQNEQKETFYTFCSARTTPDHRVLLNLKKDGTPVTPERCLGYFLGFIRQRILKGFYGKTENAVVKPIVAVDDKFNFFQSALLARVFDKAGYAKPDLITSSLAVAILYNKLHNFLSQKNVLILDVGYTSIKLSLVRVTPTEHETLDSAELGFGIRDCDMEVYVNVISELKSKYRIDYQKDKFIRFDFLKKMHQVRKTFGVTTGYVVNLAETFGTRYFDQFFRLDSKRYQSINADNFEKFQTFVSNCHQKWCMERDILIDDFQAIGGGAKVQKFVSMIEKRFETRSLNDKLSNSYSKSYGAFLLATASENLSYRLPQELKFKIYEVKKEQVNSAGGLHSSQEDTPVQGAGAIQTEDIPENKQPGVDAPAGFHNKKMAASEVDDKSGIIPGSKRQMDLSAYNVIDENFLIPGKPVQMAANGIIYAPSSPINYKKNEITVKCEGIDRSKHYQLIIIAESPEDELPTRILFKKDLQFSDFNSFAFEIDRGLLIKPMLFLPANKKVECELHQAKPVDVSRLSVYESVVSKKGEKVGEPMFNISLKEKSKCSCSHSNDTKDSKIKKHGLMNAAFLHVVTDLIQDIVMLVVGILLYFKPHWEIIDPICTIVTMLMMTGIVGQFTYRLYVRLMETVPNDINFQTVLTDLLKVPNVIEIHDLHIWEVGSGKKAATAHIVTNENKDQVLKDATITFRKYAIFHSTVQVESVIGKNQEFYVSCKNDIDT